MSLVGTRANLTHRCTIERDQNAGTLNKGAVQVADWQEHLADVHCRAWMSTGDEQVADGTTIVPAASIRVIVPAATDVTDADRVASVTYRGETYVAGPLGVRAVLRRKDHTELICQRVG